MYPSPKTIAEFRRDHPTFFERGKKRFHGDQSYHTWRGHLIIKKVSGRPHYSGVVIYIETFTELHCLMPQWLDPPQEHDCRSVQCAREVIDRALNGELAEWYARNHSDYWGSKIWREKNGVLTPAIEEELFEFLDQNKGRDLIEVAYQVRLRFGLTEQVAGKYIIKWSESSAGLKGENNG